ncbi:unnamed protein product, partial [Staurois parvus]
MICVAPAVPPVGVHQCHSCQCSSMPPASAHQCHINAIFQCLPVQISATYQCPCELSFSVTHQCLSVPPITACQCRLSVPYECRLSVPVN